MTDNEEKYIRKVQTSVFCFLNFSDEYLFMLRNPDKRVDPNRLSGIGGRLETSENWVAAAIREVKEETGYIVGEQDIKFLGLVKQARR